MHLLLLQIPKSQIVILQIILVDGVDPEELSTWQDLAMKSMDVILMEILQVSMGPCLVQVLLK